MRLRRLAPLLAGIAILACAAPAATPAPSAAPAPAAPAGPTPATPPGGQERPAGAPAVVRVGLVAPLGAYWAVYAGDALGFFAREGVTTDLTYTRGPGPSAQLLASGDLDVAINTADTAIIAMSKGADFAIVAGAQSDALFSLIAAPGIQSVPELRGKQLAMNSPRDGISAMLRRTLRAHGVSEDDVDLLSVGGTPERYAAIKSGVVAASILTQPQDVMAMAEGLPRLALVADVVGDWQNLAVIVNRAWSRTHEDALVRWLRGYIAACAWLQDPANRAQAVRILMDATQAAEDIAQRTYALYYEERAGRAMPVDGAANLAGLRNVIALIEELGNFDGEPAPPVERVVDLSYWERARR
jgi:NitT/TauT family transport system substrate-binding protein